jgi:hypothetical protein
MRCAPCNDHHRSCDGLADATAFLTYTWRGSIAGKSKAGAKRDNLG